MSLKDIRARYWRGFQPELFEALETELGPLGARYERLIQVFEFVLVERPRKGEERPREPSRLERQRSMPLAGMLAELPQARNVGSKRNAKGHQVSWIGYKLHIDSADGGIPVSCILTSASMHDSRAAIPLAEMTAARVDNLYDLMDSAYDAVEIRAHSASLGHIPIIDNNPRRSAERKQELRREATARRAIGYE